MRQNAALSGNGLSTLGHATKVRSLFLMEHYIFNKMFEVNNHSARCNLCNAINTFRQKFSLAPVIKVGPF